MDEEHGLEHMLWPDRDGDGILHRLTDDAELVDYTVAVYTSDVRYVRYKHATFVCAICVKYVGRAVQYVRVRHCMCGASTAT